MADGHEELRRVSAELLAAADQMLAAARVREAQAVARSDQVGAWARVRLSQLWCVLCCGDLDAPGGLYAASIGTGPCTCELACPRPGCQAGDGLAGRAP